MKYKDLEGPLVFQITIFVVDCETISMLITKGRLSDLHTFFGLINSDSHMFWIIVFNCDLCCDAGSIAGHSLLQIILFKRFTIFIVF